ncbi:prephenate dehydrogenase/arogenate dehydrogenase family protein [Candidatus Woesearchaeota archaeon]|nr:prephenate dehydrogenase/arogenate dehydrogenase family protein [Candidatus Woesearchaeota archaeon]
MTNVAVIGAGEMGGWFARQYAQKGLELRIADADHQKAHALASELGAFSGPTEEIIPKSDEVLIATPLDTAEGIINAHQHLLKGKTVYDIASVKNGIPEALAQASGKSLSLHPMWGGATNGFENQNLIMIPLHPLEGAYQGHFDGLKQRFEGYGTRVTMLHHGEEHDRLMAWNTALYHFNNLAMGLALSRSGMPASRHQQVEGTTATLSRICAEAVAHSDPTLYFSIQTKNPYVREAHEVLWQCFSHLRDVVQEGNYGAFAKVMQQASAYFMEGKDPQNYLKKAMSQFAAAAGAAKGAEFRHVLAT